MSQGKIASGAEHCDEDGRVCPYCGSENTDSGSCESKAGQQVEGGCTCLDCGKTWSNLYNIAGWYDEDEELHEDTRKIDQIEEMETTIKTLHRALTRIANINVNDNSEPDQMGRALNLIALIARRALQEGN